MKILFYLVFHLPVLNTEEIKIIYMFIQYRVTLVLIYMRVALFKIQLLRKSVSNSRGPIVVTSQNIGAVAPAPPAPTRLVINHVIFKYMLKQ